MEFLTAASNLPFTIALAIVLLLGIFEVIGALFGGLSAIGIDGPEVDGDLDIGGDGFFGDMLQWLHVGQLPATILGIVFLTSFGVLGLSLQTLMKSVAGAPLPLLWAAFLALFLSVPVTRLGGGVLLKVLPREETEAVSRESFLGCEAQITIGVAQRGKPAEARLRDKFGRAHYVMVEPDSDEAAFAAGSHVLILKKHGDIFRVMDINDATIEE